MSAITHANGLMSPPPTEKASSTASPPRVVLAGKTGRILCVADIRGDYHELNRLIREHEATAVIHTGDFGFITSESLDRMGDKILRHLLQYSPLLPPATRQQLLAIPPSSGRGALLTALNNSSIHFPLSQFPHLLSGAITFPVPVFTVWGLIEDVRVLEKFRTGEYEVHNLSVIDEAATRVIDVGGVRLRLFGLGGAVASHKMFDNGEGFATIAGGQGTMWATALQIGELVDTAQRVYDNTETRLFIASAPISRNGLLSQLASALKADLTISGGLHFRYPASFNEFSVHGDFDAYRQKLSQARETFMGVYQSVKDKVDSSLNENQLTLLKKALAVAQTVPEADDGTWTNTWHWVLSDASCGHMLFSITDGRVSAETKSSGLNYSHRAQSLPAPPSAPVNTQAQVTPVPRSTAPPESSIKPSVPAPAVRPTAPLVRPPSATTVRPPAVNTFNPIRPPGMGQPLFGAGRGAMMRPGATSGALPVRPQAPGSVANTSASGTAAGPAATPTAPAVRPTTQPPRGPKGPFAPTANTPPAPSSKAAESKPAQATAVAPNSRTTPAAKPSAASAKPVAPSAERNGDKPKEAAKDKDGAATPVASVPATEAADMKKDEKPSFHVNGERKQRPEPREPRQDKKEDAKASASKPNSGAATPTEEKGADGIESRPKRFSAYVRGFDTPVTDDQLKGLFPGCESTITSVKVPTGPGPDRKQRDFAYIDFVSEEALQAALKGTTSKVGEKIVSVELSNPPATRFNRERGRGGFRGMTGGRGGRGGGRGGASAGAGTGAPAGSPAAAPAKAASGGEKKD